MGCTPCQKKAEAAAAKRAEAKTSQQTRQAQAAARMQPAKGTTQSFALETNTGQTLTFGSKLEADAENVRRGYIGTVKPV